MTKNITFSWIVIHGKQLGRTIGYPTANITLGTWTIEDGVYVLRIEVDEIWYDGVGVYRAPLQLFEAHIFDFSADIYDQNLVIEIIRKIRENRKFDSLDDLKNQISKDAEEARK